MGEGGRGTKESGEAEDTLLREYYSITKKSSILQYHHSEFSNDKKQVIFSIKVGCSLAMAARIYWCYFMIKTGIRSYLVVDMVLIDRQKTSHSSTTQCITQKKQKKPRVTVSS